MVEVWGGGRLLKELQVPTALHGAVYADGWFGDGVVSWSHDESKIAYVAEQPTAHKTPEWGGKREFVEERTSAICMRSESMEH